MNFRFSHRLITLILAAIFSHSVLATHKGPCFDPNAAPEVETRLIAPALVEIADKVDAYWHFLHRRIERVEDDPKGMVKRAVKLAMNDRVLSQILQKLVAQGHPHGTGSVLVMGGASELSLGPLLNLFARVEVTDLGKSSLALISHAYRNHPYRNRLLLTQADLSGIPPDYQAAGYRSLCHGRWSPRTFTDYLQHLPELCRVPFETESFDLVVSLLVVEYLPYAPLVASLEDYKKNQGVTRKVLVEDLIPDELYEKPEARKAFARLYTHHHSEMRRVLKNKGKAMFGCWARKGVVHSGEQVMRVGDDRLSLRDWQSNFEAWPYSRLVDQEQVYGADQPPTMNLFLLEK